jgi:HEAT repeat protein
MRQIYKGKFYTMYSQIVLINLEDPAENSYPMWSGDPEEKVVFTPNGIAVGTANDVNVQVEAYVGEGTPAGKWVPVGLGSVKIGGLGFGVESPVGNQDVLNWPPGEVPVEIYVNSTDRWKVNKVVFMFRTAEDKAAPVPPIDEHVRTLIDKFKSQGGYLHDTAANALGKLGPEAIPAILEALGDADHNVREIAAGALAHLRDPRAVDPLIITLADKSSDVRRTAVNSLGNQKDLRAVEPLIAALKDSQTTVRHNAAAMLGQLKDKRAVEPLIAVIRNRTEDMFVQERAMESLGQLKDARALPHLLYALRRGNDHVRYAAARGFGYLGKPALGTLLELLEDKDKEMRRWAAFAIGTVRSKEAVAPLLRVLNDKDLKVSTAAAGALGSIRDARAVEPLIDMLGDKSADRRYIAADALAKVGDHSALPYLEGLRDKDATSTSWGAKVRDAADRASYSIKYREGRNR